MCWQVVNQINRWAGQQGQGPRGGLDTAAVVSSKCGSDRVNGGGVSTDVRADADRNFKLRADSRHPRRSLAP